MLVGGTVYPLLQKRRPCASDGAGADEADDTCEQLPDLADVFSKAGSVPSLGRNDPQPASIVNTLGRRKSLSTLSGSK